MQTTRKFRTIELLLAGVRGGADDDKGDEPEIPELPEDLSSLDEAGVFDLNEKFQTAYDALRKTASRGEHVDQLRSIRSSQKRLADHVTTGRRRKEELTELDDDAPAFPEREKATADAKADEAAKAETADDLKAEDAEAAEQAAEAEGGEGAQVPAAVSAAADEALGDTEFGDGSKPPLTNRPPIPAPLRASAGQQLVGVGEELSMEKFARAMGDTLQALAPGRDGKARAYVASVPAFENLEIQTEALSRNNGAERNTELMVEAARSWKARLAEEYGGGGGKDARTAAICDPLDIIREIPDCVTAAEPFADSLPGRPAGRLGYQFMPSASLADAAAGVTVWDETDQASVDPDDPQTWKPCVFIECPEIEDVRAEAVSACVYFDITTEMSSPERVEDIMRKVAAVKARVSEQRLLAIASQFTHNYEFEGVYGLVPESIRAVATTLEQGWATERLDDDTLYQWYVPKEMLTAWVVDLVGQAFDTQDVNDVVSYIEGKLRSGGKNVRIIPLLDVSTFPALPPVAGALATLPDGMRAEAYETWLLPPEGMLYYTTGEIATGVERSPELMRRNQAQWFMEVFHGLAKHGCQPWYRLDLTGCETGTRAALTEPWTCAGGAT